MKKQTEISDTPIHDTVKALQEAARVLNRLGPSSSVTTNVYTDMATTCLFAATTIERLYTQALELAIDRIQERTQIVELVKSMPPVKPKMAS